MPAVSQTPFSEVDDIQISGDKPSKSFFYRPASVTMDIKTSTRCSLSAIVDGVYVMAGAVEVVLDVDMIADANTSGVCMSVVDVQAVAAAVPAPKT